MKTSTKTTFVVASALASGNTGCREYPVEDMFAAYDDFLTERYECQKDKPWGGLSEEEFYERKWVFEASSEVRDCVSDLGHSRKYHDEIYFECTISILESDPFRKCDGLDDVNPNDCLFAHYVTSEGSFKPRLIDCLGLDD